jgi:hypothetical protein
MLENIRRLYPRGSANRGICVDGEGAMLGTDCVLVRRFRQGFCVLERSQASAIQKCALSTALDEDWLFRQCHRISDALNKGEIALAQIYGLRIPIRELDERHLRRIACANVAKWSFNPDEPRIPRGNPHGGEWTTEGDGFETQANAFSDDAAASGNADNSAGEGSGDDGGANALDAFLDTVSPDSDFPTDDTGSNAGGSSAPADPGLQYQLIGPAAGAAAPATAMAGTTVAADAVPTTLLGPLSAEALTGLAELAAQMSGPALFLGILFVPTNSGTVVAGTVAGSPDLSTSYDADTGVIQVWREGGPLGTPILLDTGHIGVDGLFYDPNGVVIGRTLSNGAIVDPDTLPGYRSQFVTATGADARSQAVADTAAPPKLCPDPGPDRPGAPLDNPYQRYIGELINGEALPPGLAVNLWNPLSGKLVHFDDCQLSTGTMIEAKGTGYAAILAQGADGFIWREVQQKMLNQANAQVQAAQVRPIEWYFAESTVADYVSKLFAYKDIPITVIYMPPPRWTP